MNDYVMWGIFGGAIVVALIIMGVVFWLMSAVTRSGYAAWREYAAKRGAVFREPTMDSAAAITVGIAGAPFEVAFARIVQGEHARMAIRGRSPNAMPMQLRVYTEGSISGVGGMHGLPLVATDDAAFDREFLVKSDDSERTRATVDASLRQRLQRFPQRPLALTYDRGAIELLWEPAGFDGAHIDAAIAMLEALCGKSDALATPYART